MLLLTYSNNLKGVRELAALIEIIPSSKLRNIVKITLVHFQRAEVGRQAAELAYYILLSLFPVLLALGNLIPLLPIPTEQVLKYVEMGVPEEVGSLILPILEGYLSGGSSGAITFGVIFTIWPASKAFSVFQKVLNQVYDAEIKRNFIFARIFSFLIALSFVLLLGAVAFIFVFGQEILSLVQQFLPIDLLGFITTFEYFRWLVAFGVLIILTAFIYYFIPNVKWSFKYAVPGAIFATVGFLLISQLFSLYLSFAGGQAIGNGTIGVFIVLMIWLYLLGIVFILGGILNVIIYDYKHEDEIVFDEGDTYVSIIYSDKAKEYLVKEQILRKRLIKDNPKITLTKPSEQ